MWVSSFVGDGRKGVMVKHREFGFDLSLAINLKHKLDVEKKKNTSHTLTHTYLFVFFLFLPTVMKVIKMSSKEKGDHLKRTE